MLKTKENLYFEKWKEWLQMTILRKKVSCLYKCFERELFKTQFFIWILKSVLSVINNSLNKGLGHHIGWDLKTSNILQYVVKNVFDNVWKSIKSNIMQDFNLKSTGHMGIEQLS